MFHFWRACTFHTQVHRAALAHCEVIRKDTWKTVKRTEENIYSQVFNCKEINFKFIVLEIILLVCIQFCSAVVYSQMWIIVPQSFRLHASYLLISLGRQHHLCPALSWVSWEPLTCTKSSNIIEWDFISIFVVYMELFCCFHCPFLKSKSFKDLSGVMCLLHVQHFVMSWKITWVPEHKMTFRSIVWPYPCYPECIELRCLPQ